MLTWAVWERSGHDKLGAIGGADKMGASSADGVPAAKQAAT